MEMSRVSTGLKKAIRRHPTGKAEAKFAAGELP
jgi:hypothetical protein